MKYFRNYEVANLYRVSQATVGRWVEQAKHGKISLDLHEHAGKSYIANTEHNRATIENLIGERRKFRNTNAAKTITPKPEFYQLYNQAQLYDIVRNLDIYREIPRQYNYFDGGADNWDRYAERLASEKSPNLLKSTIELLADNQGYLDRTLAGVRRVNIVDIGVGNALPVKDFLGRLLERGILGRYIAVDISVEMLATAKRNIRDWFKGRVTFEGYEMDIASDRFTNILAEEYLKDDSEHTVNLVLLLGGTLSNLRKPDIAFNTIHESMSRNDLLVYSLKLDNATSRRYFDFNPEPGKTALSPNHRFIFDLLNIDDSFYDVEMGFDEEEAARYIRVRLKVALTINFDFDEGQRSLEFEKGETILLWRSWQATARDIDDQFSQSGFDIIHSSQTLDQEYILTVSKVHTDR